MTTARTGLTGLLVAGVDVGGTKTSIVVTDDRDRVLYEHVTPTDGSALVAQIAGLVEGAQRQLGQQLAAVGVAVPGQVDADAGSVSTAVNLGITHLRLGPLLEDALGVPAVVEHEARAAARWLCGRSEGGSAHPSAPGAVQAIGTRIEAG
ncbi:MAG: ROK family protein, partial [Candidatus Limnocylindrales bacterium]